MQHTTLLSHSPKFVLKCSQFGILEMWKKIVEEKYLSVCPKKRVLLKLCNTIVTNILTIALIYLFASFKVLLSSFITTGKDPVGQGQTFSLYASVFSKWCFLLFSFIVLSSWHNESHNIPNQSFTSCRETWGRFHFLSSVHCFLGY